MTESVQDKKKSALESNEMTDTSNGDTNVSSKLFFTTTDLMESINQALAQNDDDTTTTGNNSLLQPRFELQRRLPDGSTRKCNAKDAACADLESKFQQAAAQVQSLSLWTEKLDWAQRQRQEGNKLYQQGQYKEAIDVYLTCLVVKPSQEQDDEHRQEQFFNQVFLPVMNNLAQCTLKLGMYTKTETFCTMALEDPTIDCTSLTNNTSLLLVTKLYYCRAKARRLRGLYDLAQVDLEHATTQLVLLSDEDAAASRKAIEKELQLLQRAKQQGQRNEFRQERAMKQLFDNSNESNHGDTRRPAPIDSSLQTTTTTTSPGLYSDLRQRRTHSTLRAKRHQVQDEEEEQDDVNNNDESNVDSPFSFYWHYYLTMVGRIAERLLMLLGDDEYQDKGDEAAVGPLTRVGDEKKRD